MCSTHKYVPELPRENRVREVNRRGHFDGRQKLLRVLCLSSLNNVRLPHMQIPPVSAAKQNGAGSDLVLNNCLAYPRFGRFSNWPFGVKRFSDYPPQQCRSRSRARASLRKSAPRPFHHGVRRRGGTIYWAALPSDERRIQATKRTHLIHRPARDIMPPRGGARVSSYSLRSCNLMPLRLPWSSGIRCHQPRCDA